MRLMPPIWALPILLVLGLACATGARADAVTDQIDQALAAYRRHDFPAAMTALDGAAALVRQARAQVWRDLLPPPLPGWDADEPETTALGAALLGGGTGASRHYHHDHDSVDVQILTDSPMLEGMAAILGSVLANVPGNRTVAIGGETLVYIRDDNAYTTMVVGRVMVRVEGSRDVGEPVLRAFVRALHFDDIRQQVR